MWQSRDWVDFACFKRLNVDQSDINCYLDLSVYYLTFYLDVFSYLFVFYWTTPSAAQSMSLMVGRWMDNELVLSRMDWRKPVLQTETNVKCKEKEKKGCSERHCINWKSGNKIYAKFYIVHTVHCRVSNHTIFSPTKCTLLFWIFYITISAVSPTCFDPSYDQHQGFV
jgi:hypothetical protein